MAASSSSDEGTGPNYHLSSSLDSGSRLSPNRSKCPLCSNFKKNFLCKDCVHSGDFRRSNSSCDESYSEKQLRYLQLKVDRKNVEEKCLPYIEKKQKVDVLNSKIRQSKDRIRILKLALEEKKKKQKVNAERLTDLTSTNEKQIISLPKYNDRVNKLASFITNRQEDIEKNKEKLSEVQEELKKITKIRINQLVRYIFPIKHIQPKVEMVESAESEIVSALSEATHTTYIKNKWIYTDNSGEYQHSIVWPTLPGSGNYSAYNLWVSQNKDAPPGGSVSTPVVSNAAYNISAALTYTAQLVHVLSYYLDVRLPYRMVYSDFCSSDMTEQQFSRRVARLNANVLQLCFSQNVNLANLHPAQTLHNILQLIDASNEDLGRQGPMEVDASMANSLEQQLAKELQTSEDSDSEEGDAFSYDWEAVPRVQCPEATAGPINQSSQMVTTQQATSMAGGLVTSAAASIASIWRGWTGR